MEAEEVVILMKNQIHKHKIDLMGAAITLQNLIYIGQVKRLRELLANHSRVAAAAVAAECRVCRECLCRGQTQER